MWYHYTDLRQSCAGHLVGIDTRAVGLLYFGDFKEVLSNVPH